MEEILHPSIGSLSHYLSTGCHSYIPAGAGILPSTVSSTQNIFSFLGCFLYIGVCFIGCAPPPKIKSWFQKNCSKKRPGTKEKTVCKVSRKNGCQNSWKIRKNSGLFFCLRGGERLWKFEMVLPSSALANIIGSYCSPKATVHQMSTPDFGTSRTSENLCQHKKRICF